MNKKIAIVLGASRGIGAATALRLAGAGAHVTLASRDAGACQAVRDQADDEFRAQSEAVACDATDPVQVEALVSDVYARHGRIDWLINNLGTMDPVDLIADSDPDAWTRGVAINLFGPFYACRATLPYIRESGGVIVNLSTAAADHALPGWSSYCVSKAGLVTLTQMIAAETADSGVRVYGFRPGMVNTELSREGLRKKINRIAELDPTSFSSPEVPARAIVWLCTQAPKDLSGQEIDITEPATRARILLED